MERYTQVLKKIDVSENLELSCLPREGVASGNRNLSGLTSGNKLTSVDFGQEQPGLGVMRLIKEDKMRIGRGLVIFVAILACTIIPGNIYALTALDFSKYLPDQIGRFNTTGGVNSENLIKGNSMFHRAQRFYSSEKGALCILAVVKGAGVPVTIKETFAKGSKINIEKFDAVQIILDNNSVSASVKLGQDLLVTAVGLNTKDINIPISILKEIDLRGISILGTKDVGP
jgi:hypothetical protein